MTTRASARLREQWYPDAMRRVMGMTVGLALVWACGGKAVVDEGTGGQGGTTTGSAVGTPTGSGTGSPVGTPTGSGTGSPVGTPTGSGTGSPSGTPTGTISCDVGDCNACMNSDCATNVCMVELNDCVASQQCIELNDCWWQCDSDPACLDQCDAQYPAGAPLLHALYECLVCNACPVDCQGYVPCPPG